MNSFRERSTLVVPRFQRTIITSVHVVELEGRGRILRDRHVVITDDTYCDISRSLPSRDPQGTRVIDGRGTFLVPGFASAAPFTSRLADRLVFPIFLAHGIVSARFDCGVDASLPLTKDMVNALGSKVRRGALPGPQVEGTGNKPYVIAPAAQHVRLHHSLVGARAMNMVEILTDVRSTLRALRTGPRSPAPPLPPGPRAAALAVLERELDLLAVESGSRASASGYACRVFEVMERVVARGGSPASALRTGAGKGGLPIAPGAPANGVLVSGNPLEDIRACRMIQMVLQDGRLYDQDALARVLRITRHDAHRFRLACAAIARSSVRTGRHYACNAARFKGGAGT